MRRVAALLLLGLALPAVARARGGGDLVRAGSARFEVLTSTLVRLEYAADRRFENRPTMTADRARLPYVPVAVSRSHGWLRISTTQLRLRYRLGSGQFSSRNLLVTFSRGGRRSSTVTPAPGHDQGNLGGWRRALDLLDAPVTLHPGLLARGGWYVLDDTRTAILTSAAPGFAVRPSHRGGYQDWYLFAYGRDYARGLEDLRALTGPAPLLPRTAFGVWFSRYYPYSDQDYHGLLAQFRTNRVPLDTLSVDTDFKRESSVVGAAAAATVAGAPGKPYSWNGWEWDPQLFPDPKGFISWSHSQGLSIALNIHPSIDTTDPKYPATSHAAGGLRISSGECRILIADPTGECAVFDWANPRQLAAYFSLHSEFEQDGADIFWLDWCCDDSGAAAPGLTADTWINSRYAALERSRGLRWLSFARAGASYSATDGFDGDTQDGGAGIFAEHRYTIQFTGDTCATWAMLGFEAQFSAEEGNVGLPYVSDDIGSFHGQPVQGRCGPIGTSALSARLPDDLYARWVAFGTFQPLDRLHSDHGDRLPWEYGAAADAAAAGFLRLREALVPYTYTLARRAYDTGLPLTGALYLDWPAQDAAYRQPSEYTFGPDVVVEPVTAPGDPAPASVWVPPGSWIDYFTGARYRGPRAITLSVPLSQMPVLVRAGAIVPTEPYQPFTPPGPQRSLTLTAFPGARGSFRLYDDQGLGFGYTRRAYSFTAITQTRRGRRETLVIGPARGSFAGMPAKRSWDVVFVGVRRPSLVSVNGRHVSRFSYEAGTLSVATGPTATNRRVVVTAR